MFVLLITGLLMGLTGWVCTGRAVDGGLIQERGADLLQPSSTGLGTADRGAGRYQLLPSGTAR
jgi:hypothetical protein